MRGGDLAQAEGCSHWIRASGRIQAQAFRRHTELGPTKADQSQTGGVGADSPSSISESKSGSESKSELKSKSTSSSKSELKSESTPESRSESKSELMVCGSESDSESHAEMTTAETEVSTQSEDEASDNASDDDVHFEFFHGRDVDENDIENAGRALRFPEDVERLRRRCVEIGGVAFNTNGWIKRSVPTDPEELNWWTDDERFGIYIRVDENGEILSEAPAPRATPSTKKRRVVVKKAREPADARAPNSLGDAGAGEASSPSSQERRRGRPQPRPKVVADSAHRQKMLMQTLAVADILQGRRNDEGNAVKSESSAASSPGPKAKPPRARRAEKKKVVKRGRGRPRKCPVSASPAAKLPSGEEDAGRSGDPEVEKKVDSKERIQHTKRTVAPPLPLPDERIVVRQWHNTHGKDYEKTARMFNRDAAFLRTWLTKTPRGRMRKSVAERRRAVKWHFEHRASTVGNSARHFCVSQSTFSVWIRQHAKEFKDVAQSSPKSPEELPLTPPPPASAPTALQVSHAATDESETSPSPADTAGAKRDLPHPSHEHGHPTSTPSSHAQRTTKATSTPKRVSSKEADATDMLSFQPLSRACLNHKQQKRSLSRLAKPGNSRGTDGTDMLSFQPISCTKEQEHPLPLQNPRKRRLSLQHRSDVTGSGSDLSSSPSSLTSSGPPSSSNAHRKEFDTQSILLPPLSSSFSGAASTDTTPSLQPLSQTSTPSVTAFVSSTVTAPSLPPLSSTSAPSLSVGDTSHTSSLSPLSSAAPSATSPSAAQSAASPSPAPGTSPSTAPSAASPSSSTVAASSLPPLSLVPAAQSSANIAAPRASLPPLSSFLAPTPFATSFVEAGDVTCSLPPLSSASAGTLPISDIAPTNSLVLPSVESPRADTASSNMSTTSRASTPTSKSSTLSDFSIKGEETDHVDAKCPTVPHSTPLCALPRPSSATNGGAHTSSPSTLAAAPMAETFSGAPIEDTAAPTAIPDGAGVKQEHDLSHKSSIDAVPRVRCDGEVPSAVSSLDKSGGEASGTWPPSSETRREDDADTSGEAVPGMVASSDTSGEDAPSHRGRVVTEANRDGALTAEMAAAIAAAAERPSAPLSPKADAPTSTDSSPILANQSTFRDLTLDQRTAEAPSSRTHRVKNARKEGVASAAATKAKKSKAHKRRSSRKGVTPKEKRPKLADKRKYRKRKRTPTTLTENDMIANLNIAAVRPSVRSEGSRSLDRVQGSDAASGGELSLHVGRPTATRVVRRENSAGPTESPLLSVVQQTDHEHSTSEGDAISGALTTSVAESSPKSHTSQPSAAPAESSAPDVVSSKAARRSQTLCETADSVTSPRVGQADASSTERTETTEASKSGSVASLGPVTSLERTSLSSVSSSNSSPLGAPSAAVNAQDGSGCAFFPELVASTTVTSISARQKHVDICSSADAPHPVSVDGISTACVASLNDATASTLLRSPASASAAKTTPEVTSGGANRSPSVDAEMRKATADTSAEAAESKAVPTTLAGEDQRETGEPRATPGDQQNGLEGSFGAPACTPGGTSPSPAAPCSSGANMHTTVAEKETTSTKGDASIQRSVPFSNAPSTPDCSNEVRDSVASLAAEPRSSAPTSVSHASATKSSEKALPPSAKSPTAAKRTSDSKVLMRRVVRNKRTKSTRKRKKVDSCRSHGLSGRETDFPPLTGGSPTIGKSDLKSAIENGSSFGTKPAATDHLPPPTPPVQKKPSAPGLISPAALPHDSPTAAADSVPLPVKTPSAGVFDGCKRSLPVAKSTEVLELSSSNGSGVDTFTRSSPSKNDPLEEPVPSLNSSNNKMPCLVPCAELKHFMEPCPRSDSAVVCDGPQCEGRAIGAGVNDELSGFYRCTACNKNVCSNCAQAARNTARDLFASIARERPLLKEQLELAHRLDIPDNVFLSLSASFFPHRDQPASSLPSSSSPSPEHVSTSSPREMSAAPRSEEKAAVDGDKTPVNSQKRTRPTPSSPAHGRHSSMGPPAMKVRRTSPKPAFPSGTSSGVSTYRAVSPSLTRVFMSLASRTDLSSSFSSSSVLDASLLSALQDAVHKSTSLPPFTENSSPHGDTRAPSREGSSSPHSYKHTSPSSDVNSPQQAHKRCMEMETQAGCGSSGETLPHQAHKRRKGMETTRAGHSSGHEDAEDDLRRRHAAEDRKYKLRRTMARVSLAAHSKGGCGSSYSRSQSPLDGAGAAAAAGHGFRRVESSTGLHANGGVGYHASVAGHHPNDADGHHTNGGLTGGPLGDGHHHLTSRSRSGSSHHHTATSSSSARDDAPPTDVESDPNVHAEWATHVAGIIRRSREKAASMKRMKRQFDDDERRLSMSPSPSPLRRNSVPTPSPSSSPAVADVISSRSQFSSPSSPRPAASSTVTSELALALVSGDKQLLQNVRGGDGRYRIPPTGPLQEHLSPRTSRTATGTQILSPVGSNGTQAEFKSPLASTCDVQSFSDILRSAGKQAQLTKDRATRLTNLRMSLRDASVAVARPPVSAQATNRHRLANAAAAANWKRQKTHTDSVSASSSPTSNQSSSTIYSPAISNTTSPSTTAATMSSSATTATSNRRSLDAVANSRTVPSHNVGADNHENRSSLSPSVSYFNSTANQSHPESRSRLSSISRNSQGRTQSKSYAQHDASEETPSRLLSSSPAQTSTSVNNSHSPLLPTRANLSHFSRDYLTQVTHLNSLGSTSSPSALPQEIARIQANSSSTFSASAPLSGGLGGLSTPRGGGLGGHSTPRGGGLGAESSTVGGSGSFHNDLRHSLASQSADAASGGFLSPASQATEAYLSPASHASTTYHSSVSQAAGTANAAYVSNQLDLQRQLEMQRQALILKESAFLRERLERIKLEAKLAKQREALESLARGLNTF